MENQAKTFTPKIIIQLLIVVVIMPLLPQIISGRWNWWEAWVFSLTLILGFVLSRLVVAQRHPDLLAERAHSMDKKDAKSWDKKLAPSLSLGIALIPLVAGLDELYHWSGSFSLWIKIVAIVFILLGYVLATYAMFENKFFSGLVRIQTDRGHHVISSGPYRWMRHPGYTGTLITFVASPFLLDTWWGLIPVVLLLVVLFVRTSKEDQTLQAELKGYADYAQKVKYRLIPGIW
jgi:protein-S-isoprenylcysteine O-methyltransferase Ste14